MYWMRKADKKKNNCYKMKKKKDGQNVTTEVKTYVQ